MNKDQKRRDEIMKLENPKYVGGLERFDELNAEQLETLLKENFLSAKDTKGSSPNVQELLEFMKTNEDLNAHGFVVSGDRDDCRMVIEGVVFYGRPSEELKENFFEMFHSADDLRIEKDELYCFYG